MKHLLSILTISIFMASAGTALAHHGPKDITFDAKMGNVAFSHGAHQDDLKIECQTCHHTGFEPVQKCGECHGEMADAPNAKDAFHTLCKGCHQEKGQGPTGCRDCHKK